MTLADSQGVLYLYLVKFELNIKQTSAGASRRLFSIANQGNIFCTAGRTTAVPHSASELNQGGPSQLPVLIVCLYMYI